jgi:sugar (pentulose or hexulose) kinase
MDLVFLGIDLGTSFIKGAVLDLEARRVRNVRRTPFPDPLPNPNALFCEYDPDEVVKAAGDFLNELSSFAPACDGIVMCAQMHGMVLLDEKGEARSRCISWRDQRALMPHPSGEGTYFDAYHRRINAEHRRDLGNELRPGTPGGFLFWLSEQGKLEPGLLPASIPDYVLHGLTGSEPSVDLTNGMAYGLLDLRKRDWHYSAIEALGLPRLHWPVVRRQGEVAGKLQIGGRAVPCYTPSGDFQCAVAGTLIDAHELSLNISTGSQVSRLTPELALGDYQTRPFFDGQFLNTITHVPGGRSLDLLIDLLGELAQSAGVSLPNPWPYIARQVEETGRTDLRAELYFFAGPFGDRGAISNIRGDNLTVGHLFRAAFDNMADTYHQCGLRIWPERSWQNLVFSGGLAAKLEVLREIIRKKFQADYRLAPCPEDTLLGLLALALVFSGKSASVEQAMAELRAQEQAYLE